MVYPPEDGHPSQVSRAIFLFGAFSLDDFVQLLEKEVNMDFCRSMNRIIFDKTVNKDPVTFAFVTLPDADVKDTPQQGATRGCLLYTSPSPRDRQKSRMPSSA